MAKDAQESITSHHTYSFEISPEPIPANLIKETVTKDVVILGGGASGIVAAASAAEAGAKTILLEKYNSCSAQGGAIHAINTQEQLKKRIKTDVNKVVQELVLASEGYADARLFRKWATQSGPVMDWLINIADKAGVRRIPMGPMAYHFGIPDLATVICEEFFNMLLNHGKKFGLEVRFNTAAAQLVRQNSQGRVTGVIAKNEDGSFSQFNAQKAIVICTGDHGNNPEMMQKYAPWAANCTNMYLTKANTGDGLQMALWIGAAVEDSPHCAMVHFLSTNAIPAMSNRPVTGLTAMGMDALTTMTGGGELNQKPFLYVNKVGERFGNESLSDEYLANLVLRQPGKNMWQVFDAKSLNDDNRDAVDRTVKTGEVLNADTIEELALKFGADPAKFKTAVNRYNELVKAKNDADFGKDPKGLGIAIDKPPFYACESPPNLLVCIGGPKINTEAQVLDTSHNVIPGLYAAGNVAGGFWGHIYPMSKASGMARGLAVTFGRIAGINAATL